MALDEFGKISAAEIVFYAPVLCTALFIVFKHGFSRKEGYVYLFTFSLVRILGSILSLVAKSSSNPSTGLLVAVGVLQALGLSPLLLATLGFVTNIALYGLPSFTNPLRLVRLVLVVGLILAIVAGTDLSPDNSPSDQATGHTLSRVGTILFLVSYIALFGIHVLLWRVKENIPTHHRTLLLGVSLALPFLAVRVLYSVLGAFVPSPSRWSATTGDWRIYLVMGLIMEYIVVCTYVVAGVVTPLHKDEEGQVGGHVIYQPTARASGDGLLEMGNTKYGYAQPYQP